MGERPGRRMSIMTFESGWHCGFSIHPESRKIGPEAWDKDVVVMENDVEVFRAIGATRESSNAALEFILRSIPFRILSSPGVLPSVMGSLTNLNPEWGGKPVTDGFRISTTWGWFWVSPTALPRLTVSANCGTGVYWAELPLQEEVVKLLRQFARDVLRNSPPNNPMGKYPFVTDARIED